MRNKLIVFSPEFLEDLSFWVKVERKTASKILELVNHVMRYPFEGIGKPEPLKHIGNDIWSRRITSEHRLVYLVLDDRIEFIQCRFHY
ncbi:MAG: Txe/YoeB family addiction module toxin [Melioribacteraceae bacterium]|nr:Txe/YoeB family addiction module toxin [Melioribacteraceae bacterium]